MNDNLSEWRVAGKLRWGHLLLLSDGIQLRTIVKSRPLLEAGEVPWSDVRSVSYRNGWSRAIKARIAVRTFVMDLIVMTGVFSIPFFISFIKHRASFSQWLAYSSGVAFILTIMSMAAVALNERWMRPNMIHVQLKDSRQLVLAIEREEDGQRILGAFRDHGVEGSLDDDGSCSEHEGQA
jgi:hypothetical protein